MGESGPNRQHIGKLDVADETYSTPIIRTTNLFNRFEHLLFGFAFAGFKGNYHSINELRVLGRQILVVDEVGLHLLWKDSDNPIEYIKPLPRAFVTRNFTLRYSLEDLSPVEVGFLYSYSRLIKSPLDLKLALDLGLVDERFQTPKGDAFCKWKRFIKPFQPDDGEPPKREQSTAPANAHVRFHYGDLRLSRLYVSKGWFIKQFYNTRSPFISFQRAYVKWLIVVLAVISTVLSSMQVALQAAPQFVTFQNIFQGFAEGVLFLVAFNLAWIFQILFIFLGVRTVGWLLSLWGPSREVQNSKV